MKKFYEYDEKSNVFMQNEKPKSKIDKLVKNTTGISLDESYYIDDNIDRNEFNRAMRTATRIISRSYPSEKMLREKLYKKYSYETSDYVVDKLLESQVIGDFDLAFLLLDEGLFFKKYGTRRIKDMMRKKFIPYEIIEEVIRDIDSDILFENALYHAKQKIKNVDDEDRFSLQKKLSNYLTYRGFDFSIINKVIDHLLKEEEY